MADRSADNRDFLMSMVKVLRWTASVFGMVAAIIVALNAGSNITCIGFIIVWGSSMVWIAASLFDGNSRLAIQNVVLLGINLFGVYRYLCDTPAAAGAKSA